MNIVRTKDAAWTDGMQKGAYGQRRKKLGGEGFSSSLWELPPGKKSFPFHRHSGTEEALFGIAGQAKVRTSDGLVEIGVGDFVSFAPGDAHQLVNDGSEPFVYVAVGISKGFEVTEYPDSKKVHVSYGAPPNAKSLAFRQKDAVGYFEDEPDAE